MLHKKLIYLGVKKLKAKCLRINDTQPPIKNIFIKGLRKLHYRTIGNKLILKKRKSNKFILSAKILLIIFILTASFYSGIKFNSWGGIDKLVPIVIDFIRDNFLGDKIVLNIEKEFFTFNDYLKQIISLKENINNSIENIKNEKSLLNNHLKSLTDEYVKDYKQFKSYDYDNISTFLKNSLVNIKPLYDIPLKNEGVWEKYFISPKTYKPLYAKTFIRSDLNRSYVKVYLYVFDMDRLNLEFIPGKKDLEEEFITGKMNSVQKSKVLWIFSGGYQYQHGNYGIKYNGNILLPPKKGAQTIFFHKDGSLKIKEWTADTIDDNNIIHFRQNELPLIKDGKMNYDIKYYWGFTEIDKDPIFTVRSGIGMTDNNSLVFAFGENLSPKSLCLAMTLAGVKDGMHLDMNYFNVHFIRIERSQKGRLKTINENEILSYYNNIYIYGSSRDYFIITEK